MHSSALIFNIVKWAGVAYLLWLAYSALREGGALRVEAAQTVENGPRIATRGALINILNPKLSIFFLSLLTPFLSGNPATVTQEILLLGGVFMAMTFAVFVLYGAAATALGQQLRRPKISNLIRQSAAAAFAALGARLALSSDP